MAVTPSGWPYAVPNDTLVSWPAQSQALADKLELRIPGGSGAGILPFAMATGSVSVTGNATITLPASRFTQAPLISVSVLSASGASGSSVTFGTSTTASFTTYVWSGAAASTTSRTVHWTAIQMTSSSSAG